MLKRLLNSSITKKRIFQIGTMFSLLLIFFTASCEKDDGNYSLDDNSEPGPLSVNVAFNGDLKPAVGDELVVNLYYGEVIGTSIEDLEPDATKVIPLTETEITYGVRIPFENFDESQETVFANAHVDINGDDVIGPGDLAVFYNQQSFEDVSEGNASLGNIAGKEFVTINMEQMIPEIKKVHVTFNGEVTPTVGNELTVNLFYDEINGNTVDALFPAASIQVVLNQDNIDNGLTVTFEDFQADEIAFVNAHVDINNDGEINAGDLGEFYNDKTFITILDKIAFPDDVAEEEIVDVDLDLVIEVVEEEAESVTDIDGNVYTVVTIGEQVWLVENFRATRYRNGDPIKTGLTKTEWGNATEGAYGVYPFELVEGIDSEEAMAEKYGLLYNGFAVSDDRNLAPEGWRVATDADWQELESYIGVPAGSLNGAGWRGEVASTILTPEAGGSDNFGLSIQPAGLRQKNGNYEKQGNVASLWSYQYKNGYPQAVRRLFQSGNNGIHRGGRPAQEGLSVRLIKIE